MRAAVESYPASSQSSMMRDFNIVMNEVETFDEREVINQLSDDSFNRRAEILEKLRTSVRMHHNLPIQNTIGLYQGLERSLADSNWDVRRQCILLIAEYIPLLRVDVDACMSLVLPRLITSIGDSRIVIRRGVIQTLHTYMKYTNDMPSLMRYYVTNGLEHPDTRVRKESTVSLPLLITTDFASEDFSELIVSLCKKLVDRNEEENIQQLALVALNKLRGSTGDAKFKAYLMKLNPQLRDYYCQVANFQIEPEASTQVTMQQFYNQGAPVSRSSSQHVELHYGFVPPHVMAQLSDENFRNRGHAVEQLKMSIESLHTVSPLMPHIGDFISMLNELLEDNNFKIITVTLDIMGILVEKTSHEIRPHLKPVIQTLTKRMGDNKNVIRQAITRVIIQLMQILGPKLVLLLLCDNLSHRSPRVRTEAINIIINALLTFPSYEFDLPSLCSSMAYCLLDSKRSVRHACLECFAVLAQCLGAGKLTPLIHAVQSLEQLGDSEGVMAAVQARLTRRVLPRRNEDNLIDYAVQLPNLNSSRNGSLGQQGADLDWILAGSGAGGNSARSMRLEDLESSSRQSSASLDGRRYLSSGKKSKLPWDDVQSSPNGEAASPGKSKQTWADEPQHEGGSKKSTKHSKHREDIMLASMSYTSSPDLTHVEQMESDSSSQHPSSPNKPPFSKSNKASKSEPNTSRTIKSNQKLDDSSKSAGVGVTKPVVLNPLPVSMEASSSYNTWTVDPNDTTLKEPSPSSIPVKASTVNRKSGGNKKPSKVPPIQKSHSPITIDDEALKRGVDANANELPQLNASLNKIRNSASKKKAEKLFEKLEKQQSEVELKPPPHQSKSTPVKVDNPFEAKPKLARHNSLSKPKTYSELAAEKIPAVTPLSQVSKQPETRLSKSDSLVKIKSRAEQKVTGGSGDPKDEMVAIVGRGYSEDAIEAPPKQSTQVKSKQRRQSTQKPGTGSSLSPLGLAASSAPGMIPLDDDGNPDMVSVVGRGMFDGDVARKERSNSISKPAMVGVRTERSNSLSKSSGYGTLEPPDHGSVDSDEEEMDSLKMSRGLLENVAKKKQQRQEESAAKRRAQLEREETQRLADEEQRRIEQEQAAERRIKKQQEAAEKRRKELDQRRREQEVKNTELDPALKIDGNTAMRSKTRSPPPTSAPTTTAMDESLRPFSKPSVAFKDAMKLLSNDDWSHKTDGINKIRRLIQFHPDVIAGSLHSVTLAMLAEVKNLRTQVARLAIVGLGDLFTTLKKGMDPELETCSKVLLHKNGEANEFIRTELDRTLSAMVSDTTPQRCIGAIVTGGGQHKNGVVRKVAAQHMVTLCEKLGPGRILSGVKDITDKVLPTIASLSTDSSPETRWLAKKIMVMLLQHPDFESMLNKHVTPKDSRDVMSLCDTLRNKGLGDMPSDSPSAKGARRSGTFNRGSRTNSAESTDSISSVKGRRSLGPQAAEDTVPLLEAMSSTNWSTRHESINELLAIAQTKPRILSAQSVKIFDKYAMLIKDSNSKVALHALNSLESILPTVKQQLTGSSVNLLIQNTAAGLASKNRDIYDKASSLLDSFINNIDHTLLFQPFVQVAMNATARTKPDIIDRVTYLSKKVYKNKQKAVILHALPLAWNLVKSLSSTGSTPALKDATGDFLAQLHELMNDSLFDHAASAPGSNPQFVDKIRELSQSRS